MHDYFKLLENYIIGFDKNFNSIKDLTFALMEDAGYYRCLYTFKNGNKRERTAYKKEFDSYLTALWILFYKKLFISKLSKHLELQEYFVYIINKTFFIVLGYANKDKFTCDDVINRYVNQTLDSRIKEVQYYNNSKFLLEKYVKGNKRKFLQKNAILNQAVLLDDLSELQVENEVFDLNENNYIEFDLREKLNNNFWGLKLLNIMLYSNKKISLKNVDKLLNMKKDDCTEENKLLILSAYDIIKKTLLEYTNYNFRFRKSSLKSIKYSFE